MGFDLQKKGLYVSGNSVRLFECKVLKITRSTFSFESLHKYRERERERKIETERDDLIVDG